MLDINNKKDFDRIRESLMEELDKKYEEVSLNDMLKSLKNEPLYSLNNIFENFSANLCNTKEGSKCIAKFIDTIKENTSLLNAYAMLYTINHAENIKSPDIFVNEVATLSKNIDEKQYRVGMDTLSKIVKKCVMESKATSDEVSKAIEEAHTELNEAINYIIENKKSISNVGEYSNNMAIITEQMNVRAKKEESEVCDKSVKELMDDINETAEGYTNGETNAIKEIALSTISGKSNREIYESFKNRCITLLSETISSDIAVEDKARFQKMMEQIKGKEYKEETLNEDVLNFARLYETLKES